MREDMSGRIRRLVEIGAPAYAVEIFTEVLQTRQELGELRGDLNDHLKEHKDSLWQRVWPPVVVLLTLAVLVYVIAPAVAQLTP